jgi:tRNA A37 threonylcarbamoyladenosine dehydratase
MRHELRRRGVKRLKVVYSREEPLKADAAASEGAEPGSGRRSVPASISFVPPVAGFIIAAEVVKELIGD